MKIVSSVFSFAQKKGDTLKSKEKGIQKKHRIRHDEHKEQINSVFNKFELLFCRSRCKIKYVLGLQFKR